MKVLLINPGWEDVFSAKGNRFNRPWPPLDLLNCAALLEKEGIAVHLLDARASPVNIDQIAHFATKFDRCFVTTSPIDRWQCPNIDITPFLKLVHLLSKEELYVMGAHGTVSPDMMLNQTNAKAIIRGEPEFTILDLCRGKKLKEIDGITFKDNGLAIHNKDRELLSLNDLPLPAFHLIDIGKYSYEILGNRLLLFEGSRGCPYPCIYCQKSMYGLSYRIKSPEKLIDEVDYGVKKFHAKSAYFIDLEFTLKRDFVEELCNGLIKRNIQFRWTCQTRADTVDLDLLKLMRKAGCKLIHFGVETGSERVMETIDKKISLSRIADGIFMAKKAGIDQACFFMFGFPTETEDDKLKTIAFAKMLNPTYASFHKVTPYPGTLLFEMVGERCKAALSPSWIEEHDTDHLNKTIRQALLEFYVRRKYVCSNILFSNPYSLIKKLRLFYNYWKSLKCVTPVNPPNG